MALAQALGFLSAFLAFWLAAGQQLANLPAYLRLSWEVASGHNWAMGVAGSTPVLVLALLVMAGNAGLAWRIWRASGDRRVAVCTTLVLGACWFLVWKHGMLRADAHPFGFFLANLLLAVTLPGALLVKQRVVWMPLALVLVERVVKWNEEIALPGQRDHALWMQVAIRPTFLGRLVALLYRPPELRFWVTDSEGQATSHRLVADVARAGFFVQPLVRRHDDFAALVDRQGSHWTRSVRFQRPDQAWLWSPPKVRFSRLPDMSCERRREVVARLAAPDGGRGQGWPD